MTIVVVKRRNNITMEGSASSINSRASAIKTILLTAWRNKLSNEEWENRIRKVLPRGVNGDVYDLADCLLKQALVGPVPNQLFISYLKHAVYSELVSHSAVLSSISNQSINLRHSSLLNRTSSVVCLLEFLKSFRDKICCKGTEVECLNLCHSLSKLIHWLLKCIHHTLDHISNTSSQQAAIGGQLHNSAMVNANNQQANQNDPLLNIIDLCTETIHYFIDRPFTKSLLFISKIEYSQEFEENILKTLQTIQQKLANSPQLQYIQERIQHIKIFNQLSLTFDSLELHPSVVAAQQLRCLQAHRIRSAQVTSTATLDKRLEYQVSNFIHDSTTNYALFNSLYPLVASDPVLRLARSYKHLARQIVTITNFYSAPAYMTYCEMIRVCMIGLIDAGKSKGKADWAFFTFLTLPKLLVELSKSFRRQQLQQNSAASINDLTPANNQSNNFFLNDLKRAFERFCAYAPLVDEAENLCNCDFFKCLIKELIKNDSSLASLKSLDIRTMPSRRLTVSNAAETKIGCGSIVQSGTFIANLLQLLSQSDQDPVEMFAMLYESCAGFKFDLTLNAATATGRLHVLIDRLVEHNELHKYPRDDLPSKHQLARALHFDITFLILVYIAQRYGPDLISKNQWTTFQGWYHGCFNQDTCLQCPREMLKRCDETVVKSLIEQIVDPNSDLQLKGVNWELVCFNLPKVINEILNAWTQGVLTDEDVSVITEKIRTRMCFLGVVAATWLWRYIRTLGETDRVKPLSFLRNLFKPAKQHGGHPKTDSDLKNDGYKERSGLARSIIMKIYLELLPSVSDTAISNSASAVGTSSNGALHTNHAGGKSNIPAVQSNVDFDDFNDKLTAHHSFKDKFISTLTTQEIFLANVKQCLSSGWINFDSLSSLKSLFKIIGCECFTNLMVEQVLSSHESPNDLSRAINIAFGLFHLDIEQCAFALLKDTIPSWLMSEKKQPMLSQPRAFALANLTVMTIIEVYTNLKSALQTATSINGNSSITNNASHQHQELEKKFALNGIKQEPGLGPPSMQQQQQSVSRNLASLMGADVVDSARLLNGTKEVKRIKLQDPQRQPTAVTGRDSAGESNLSVAEIVERLDKLNNHIANLMGLFKEIMADPVMSQRTLFPVLFLQQTVVCARESSTMMTVHLQPEILLDIISLFSSELTFELVLAISNLSSTSSRKYAAKAMCKLAQIKEAKLPS